MKDLPAYFPHAYPPLPACLGPIEREAGRKPPALPSIGPAPRMKDSCSTAPARRQQYNRGMTFNMKERCEVAEDEAISWGGGHKSKVGPRYTRGLPHAQIFLCEKGFFRP